MDEKRLDIFESDLKNMGDGMRGLTFWDGEAQELIRLARLGLQMETLTKIYGTPELFHRLALAEWAEKHGIPALQTPGEKLACTCCMSDEQVQEHFDKALSTLPKDAP